MFLHVSVILFTGGVSGEPPPPRDQADTPPPPGPRRTPPGPRRTPPRTRQNPPEPGRTPPGTKENPPGTRQNPPGTRQNPPGPRRNPPPPGTRQTPPLGPRRTTPPGPGRPSPPREEDCSIRSMSGRYASYWNAFLFINAFGNTLVPKLEFVSDIHFKFYVTEEYYVQNIKLFHIFVCKACHSAKYPLAISISSNSWIIPFLSLSCIQLSKETWHTHFGAYHVHQFYVQNHRRFLN